MRGQDLPLGAQLLVLAYRTLFVAVITE